jgi:hypothetical protein
MSDWIYHEWSSAADSRIMGINDVSTNGSGMSDRIYYRCHERS